MKDDVKAALVDFYNDTDVVDLQTAAEKLANNIVERVERETARNIQHFVQKEYGV